MLLLEKNHQRIQFKIWWDNILQQRYMWVKMALTLTKRQSTTLMVKYSELIESNACTLQGKFRHQVLVKNRLQVKPSTRPRTQVKLVISILLVLAAWGRAGSGSGRGCWVILRATRRAKLYNSFENWVPSNPNQYIKQSPQSSRFLHREPHQGCRLTTGSASKTSKENGPDGEKRSHSFA